MSASKDAIDGLARKMFQAATDEPWEAASPGQDAYYRGAACRALSDPHVIPEAAVEAAWATAWDVPRRPTCDITKNEMRLALQSAAPHMKEAWEKARKGSASEALRVVTQGIEAPK